MATRANVLIFDEYGICQKQYYVHWDGYPSSLGCRLIEIVNNAFSKRLNDRNLGLFDCSFCKRVIQFANRNIRDDVDGFLEEEEIDCLHGDIEYLYAIQFAKDDDKTAKTMCYVNVIPMPISERESKIQKKLHDTPTKGIDDKWLWMAGKHIALFEEV